MKAITGITGLLGSTTLAAAEAAENTTLGVVDQARDFWIGLSDSIEPHIPYWILLAVALILIIWLLKKH
jgi:predicted ABC-type sugar transport system permease subunit